MLYLVKKAMSEKIANEKNFFCFPVNYHKTDTAVLIETTEFAIFFTKFFRSIALLFLDLVTIQSIFSLRLWITFVILKSRKKLDVSAGNLSPAYTTMSISNGQSCVFLTVFDC